MNQATKLRRALLFVLVALLFALAYRSRFVQDDAFISFRYADNLVKGKGLVWNDGYRIEGYTNFLWTLILAIPLGLGWDPVPFTYVVGLGLFGLSLLFTYRTASLLVDSPYAGPLAVLLLGTNYTFSIYATGGLETQLQACLLIACVYVVTRARRAGGWSAAQLSLVSLLASLALLTRLDSAVLLLVPLSAALVSLLREKSSGAGRAVKLACLAGPLAVIVGGWLLWKLSYYGDLLPNTFYAKVSSRNSRETGAYFLYIFLVSYLLFPFPLLLVAHGKRLRADPSVLALALMVSLWSAYIVKIGGDFMEFRFLVPALPAFFLLVVWLLLDCIAQPAVQAALIVLVLGGSLHHSLTFGVNTVRRTIETKPALLAHISSEAENWRGIGELLGSAFPHESSVVIAVSPVGAIPFYSRLTTIDMLGLNDRWVARHGDFFKINPGHNRIAPLHYLREQGVNLVIAHPWVVSRGEPSRPSYPVADLSRFHVLGKDELPVDAEVLEIPLGERYMLVALYLVRSPIVGSAARARGWREVPID